MSSQTPTLIVFILSHLVVKNLCEKNTLLISMASSPPQFLSLSVKVLLKSLLAYSRHQIIMLHWSSLVWGPHYSKCFQKNSHLEVVVQPLYLEPHPSLVQGIHTPPPSSSKNVVYKTEYLKLAMGAKGKNHALQWYLPTPMRMNLGFTNGTNYIKNTAFLTCSEIVYVK